MKYALMGYEISGEWEQLSQAERDRRIHNHQQMLTELTVQKAMVARGQLVLASTGLHNPAKEAKTLRLRSGRHLIVDGPFAETKEALAGFDITEFESVQEAVKWSQGSFSHETHVSEIRPVEEVWWLMWTAGRKESSRFILSLCVDERRWSRLPQAERTGVLREQEQVGMQYAQRSTAFEPICLSYARLRPSAEAITLRMSGGKTVASNGPFAATEETLLGFLQLDCASKEEAIDWAKKVAVHEALAIEVRPVTGAWFSYHG